MGDNHAKPAATMNYEPSTMNYLVSKVFNIRIQILVPAA